MALSAALLAALQSSHPGAYWLLEVTIGGTTYRFANADGYPSAASGMYFGRIKSISGISSVLSDWRGGLSSGQDVTVLMVDKDRQWQQIAEGPYARFLKGSVATLYRAHPTVAKGTPSTGWYAFPYVLAGAPSEPSFGECELRLRRNDARWRAKCPSSKYVIDAVRFPDAPTASIDKVLPLLYGVHDSTATTGAGMVPLIRIGVGRYALCAGDLTSYGGSASATNVYVDGAKAPATDWTNEVIGGIEYRRGVTCPVIVFSSDPDPTGSLPVTCDCSGYQSGGVVIEDPLACLSHLILNFIDPGASLDTTSFASTFYSRSGAKAARYVDSRTAGYELVNSLALSWKMQLCAHYDGTLYFRDLDPCRTMIYQTDPWYRWYKHLKATPRAQVDTEIATSLAVQYLMDSAAGDYAGALTVREFEAADQGEENEATLDLPWGAAQ